MGLSISSVYLPLNSFFALPIKNKEPGRMRRGLSNDVYFYFSGLGRIHRQLSTFGVLGPRLEDHVERSLRCPAEVLESSGSHRLANLLLACLRAQTCTHLLRERGRHADHR